MSKNGDEELPVSAFFLEIVNGAQATELEQFEMKLARERDAEERLRQERKDGMTTSQMVMYGGIIDRKAGENLMKDLEKLQRDSEKAVALARGGDAKTISQMPPPDLG